MRQPFAPASTDPGRSGIRVLRPLALGVAVLHAVSALWAPRLGAAGQNAYLLMLVVPALLLAVPSASSIHLPPAHFWRGVLPAAALILLWAVLRLLSDLNSPYVADVPDSFLGIVDLARLIAQGKNFLTDPIEPDLPAMGSVVMAFYGLPFFRSGLFALSIPAVQVLQILWLAASAAGVGVLARRLVGPGVSLIAIAVFLFAPYTRFMTENAAPFQIGPIYATAVALCAVEACRRRSEAALAALGAVAGIAVLFPTTAPVTALFVAVTLWHLRSRWRSLWVGCATALASFTAGVWPAVPGLLALARTPRAYLHLYGVAAIIEKTVMGQLPIGAFDLGRAAGVWRPFDILAGALLAPFAVQRTPIRLWGDALFDPAGAALIAIGLAACVRSAVHSSGARLLLLFFVAALCPAFVSPVDQVDIVHAIALPVPAALLAAAGFFVARQQLGSKLSRRRAAAVAAVAIGVGGIVLFDVVNPRIVGRSAPGIMFRVLRADAADRVVVLNYQEEFNRDVKWLFTGPIATFGGQRPLGYLEYGGGQLPREELAAEGKDLLFWSPGLEQDLRVTDAVCTQWPGASLYEIWDQAHLGRVYAARVSNRGWEPHGSAGSTRTWDCLARRVPQADG